MLPADRADNSLRRNRTGYSVFIGAAEHRRFHLLWPSPNHCEMLDRDLRRAALAEVELPTFHPSPDHKPRQRKPKASKSWIEPQTGTSVSSSRLVFRLETSYTDNAFADRAFLGFPFLATPPGTEGHEVTAAQSNARFFEGLTRNTGNRLPPDLSCGNDVGNG